MNIKMKKNLVPLVFAAATLPAFAGESDTHGPMNDAWLDGKLDTVILLNRHLNPFKIETDVTNKIAVITGKVDSEVEKDLVSELAKGIEGIQEVDNQLFVEKSAKANNEKDNDAMTKLVDVSITTAISTKLLMNTEINSTEIDVDTVAKAVVLNGSVESSAEKDLVEQIAKNTFEVKSVENNLKVNSNS
ncbi:BON domain-containing protein [Aurantivibrio infirmus]